MMVKRLAPFQRAMPNADGALDRVIDRRKARPFLAGVSSKSVKNSLRQVLTSTRMFFLKNQMSKQCILLIGDTVENMHFAPISSGYKSGCGNLLFYKENDLPPSACRSKRAMGMIRTGAPVRAVERSIFKARHARRGLPHAPCRQEPPPSAFV
jgi:hypothetical protein